MVKVTLDLYDGDSPAAMRYTEARMRKISEEIMADIEKRPLIFS
jgi:DNA gyrase subunit A